MRFSLVFPHALTADALDAIPALARIASYGRRVEIDDADAAVAQMLGAAQEEFRRDLSQALRELSADGKFVEVAELVAVLARRPNR